VSPADGKKALKQVLDRPAVRIEKIFAARDIATLRATFPDDEAYGDALGAVALAIAQALVNPTTAGKDLERTLAGWRRMRFGPRAGGESDLRLLFRPTPNQRGSAIDVIAFGPRYVPDGQAIYFSVPDRIRSFRK